MCTEYFAITFMFSSDNDRILCVTRHLILELLDKVNQVSFDKHTCVYLMATYKVVSSVSSLYLLKLAAAGGWVVSLPPLHVLVCNLQDNDSGLPSSSFIARSGGMLPTNVLLFGYQTRRVLLSE
jgi:hypothetical protein